MGRRMTVTVTTGHVSAVVVLPADIDTATAHAAGACLPGGWIATPVPTATSPGPPAVEVRRGPTGVRVEGDTVHVQLDDDAASGDTLAYVTYTALERLRQRRRRTTLHGGALIGPDGGAVLLLGAKGAGKTSTALALAERGWTHAGDDLVVLGEDDQDDTLVVWSGKPVAAIRDPARPLAGKRSHVLRPFAGPEPAALRWVVRLAVHPALDSSSLTTATPFSINERLRLHEALARYISGLPTPLAGAHNTPFGPVWPMDTPALARWRSHLLARLASSRFDYLYAPSPDSAADLLTARWSGR